MADPETTQNYQKECILAAWRIQTGLTNKDYQIMRAKYLAKTHKDALVFNFMWHDHCKINHKIEDMGTAMSKLCFETLEDMQRAWMRIELRLTNFERIYGLPYKNNLKRMLNDDDDPTPMTP
jgi:phosphoribosylformylglycinamidine (FGAM) synthase-like enzyme